MRHQADFSPRHASRRRHCVTAWLVAAAVMAGSAAASAETTVSHGLSAFGDLKYGPDFTHFDYAEPDAPKGGEIRFWGLDTFDNLNPFILKGVPPVSVSLPFDSLMVAAVDEPDAMYGLIAESAELANDRSWVAFNLRDTARFHDGSAITAADVVFSFETLVSKGHPRYRILFRDVTSATEEDRLRVRFDFRPDGQTRDLPLLLAGMPVASKAYYAKVDFSKTTLEPPMGSGPYRVAKVDPGRSITYQRVEDYWARDLPVNRGRHNFDRIRYDYYRDRGIALEALFAGEYDIREEFTSKSWATQYNKPAVQRGYIKRETLQDNTPSGVQAFFFNLRRAKFQDRRIRAALSLAFDFDWLNKNLFYSLYDRTESMFENSELAAHEPPSPAELALLEPWRGQVPDEVFEKAFRSPKGAGSRKSLRSATKLLREAGYRVKDGVLTNAAGEPFEIEFLLFESTFQRVIAPYIQSLKRLGIQGRMRIVDLANFKVRMDMFDFDVIVRRYAQPLTPGIEQRNYWGSANADMVGGLNYAGIKDPAVDALVEAIIDAGSREELVAATRALDRVLTWNHYSVPQWYKGVHHIAYWDKFARPKIKPKYARGITDLWWVDKAKEQRLIDAGVGPGARK